MATTTFLVNDEATGHAQSSVWVTVTEMEDGALTFKVKQSGNIMGDLRGVFFDVTDESILNTLRVNAESNDIRIGSDAYSMLTDGTLVNELLGRDLDHDAEIEIEKFDIEKNDVNSYSFTLSSLKRKLSLSDFCNIQLDYFSGDADMSIASNDDNSHRWLYMGLA